MHACHALARNQEEELMSDVIDRASSPRIHTITPHLVVRGAAQAAEWYQQAFGAQIGPRIAVPGGKLIQIELRLGDSTVMLADEFPDMGVLSPLSVGGTYGALHIATEDADALWDRAVGAGATVHQPLQDMFWGDRHGQVIDPFGHRWGISQHLRDVPLEEITRAAAAMFGG
jgi:PhnB protein